MADQNKGLLSPFMRAAVLAFAVSFSTLLLQLVQTRIYAVVHWNHVVYFVVTIALLGFGISGTWLTLADRSRLLRGLTIPVAGAGFVVATLLSAIVLPCFNAVTLLHVFTSLPQLVRLLGTYAAAVLPYFFSGWILGTIFRDEARRIHLLYFADLAGACCGCLAFLLTIQPLGAPGLVGVCCLVVGVPALASGGLGGWRLGGQAAVVLLAGVLLFGSGTVSRAITPEPSKALVSELKNVDPDKHGVEFTEWNAISRIDVAYSETGFPFRKAAFCDGDAWTELEIAPELPAPTYDFTHESPMTFLAPYFFMEQPRSVLVIGTGGGVDVYAALRGGAQNIDAIEINPTTYRLLREEYREQTRDLFFQPGLRTFREEGRSFIRRADQRYDIIMLHATDTATAQTSGAYVLSESYLYTVEAVKDYVEHLTDTGMVCITLFGFHPGQSRLMAVCLEALYELGFAEPNRHVILHSNGLVLGTVLVRKSPFTEAETRAFAEQVKKHQGIMHYPVMQSEWTTEEQRVINTYANLRAIGKHQAYIDSLPLNIAPVRDDSPFFFLYDRPRDMLNVFSDRGMLRWNWPSFTLYALLTFSLVMVLMFMLAPLLGRRSAPLAGSGGWLLYFACLGIGFIFVEVALMQRFALLLGHPSRSLALVLASLLLAAGLGSYLSGALRLNVPRLVPVLVGLILLAAFAYPLLSRAVLGWPLLARGLVTVAMVAPLGVLMGMPFPLGLRAVSAASRDAVPWMWAVNGGCTVLGSVLAIVVAMRAGFITVLVSAAVFYALAGAIAGAKRLSLSKQE